MASLNMVQLIGNLGKDPEIRSVGSSGDKVANFSLAMTEKWTKNGEKKEKTEWVNIVVWGDGLVGVIEKYVKKGSKLYVSGQLRTRKYEKDGSDRYVTEVVVQGFGGKIVLLDGAGQKDAGRSQPEPGAHEYEDEIPF